MSTGVTLSAVVADDGTASALYTVAPAATFRLDRMAASGSATLLSGEIRVYLNGDLIDHSQSAGLDTSELVAPITLNMSDQIRADWAQCVPGSTMRLTLRGAPS